LWAGFLVLLNDIYGSFFFSSLWWNLTIQLHKSCVYIFVFLLLLRRRWDGVWGLCGIELLCCAEMVMNWLLYSIELNWYIALNYCVELKSCIVLNCCWTELLYWWWTQVLYSIELLCWIEPIYCIELLCWIELLYCIKLLLNWIAVFYWIVVLNWTSILYWITV
jgi:hypothetical protein